MSFPLKRIFVGIPICLNADALLKIEEINKNSKEFKAKWVNSANYHFTLAFIGETPEKDIPKIVEILRRSSENYNKFYISLFGLGVFPTLKNAKVLWMGTAPNYLLNGLAEQIQQNLANESILSHPENFVPHLTLARLYVPPQGHLLKKLIEKYRMQNFGEIHVNHFCLFESVFQNNSVSYKAIQQFNLT